MAKWYAASSETRFKPVPGGYVFQSPALAGDGRNHIVNEAQKTAIINILERWVLLVLFLVLLAFPLMMAVGVIVIAQVAAIWHPSQGLAAGEVLAWFILVGVVIVFVLIAYARRRLRPLLATLPTTEERITFRERMDTAALTTSGAMLSLGLGGGWLMIVFSIIVAIYGHEQRLLHAAVYFAIGAATMANFGWLILRKRTRGPRRVT
jgi:hypothetical protein